MRGPAASLRVRDGVALTVGMVVGIGVFRAPSLVAARLDDPLLILGLWVLGALVMLVGALSYAELASAYPDAGGEYHFLARAFGPHLAFLFAWARLAVVQTGAIAAVAFVLGDYAQALLALGPHGPALYAALAVAALTALNIRGTKLSARVQGGLAALLVAAVLGAAGAGLLLGGPPPEPEAAAPGEGGLAAAIGFAMIFVMLTYGGWNEAAYLSAEVANPRKGMVRVLLIAVGIIAALYLALNAAYLHVLGPAAMGRSAAIGADYMAALAGPWGGLALSILVLCAAATTLNATIFTGARSAYAWGRESGVLPLLGRWDAGAQGPVNALLVQGGLALALIGLGAAARRGFATMVEYTAPVFWLFLLLTGIALFVLRAKGGAAPAAFRVPFYPLTPALFCASSAFMLHASLAYTGRGALLGVAVLALGLAPLWLARRRAGASGPSPGP